MDLYTYNAKLERVVDGDTIWALVDLGFQTWKRVNIRFWGIDAYESRTRDLEEKALGLMAKDLVIEALNESDGKFILRSRGLDKYGRALGEIIIDESGSTLNQKLVAEGLAVEYFGGTR